MGRIRLLTGIDLPLAPSCGSMILCSDAYTAIGMEVSTRFLCLPPVDESWKPGFDEVEVCTSRKAPYGPDFERYVDELTAEVAGRLQYTPHDVVHAQHLGYGLSLAFSRTITTKPMLAIAHGTDVIDAMASPQALAALREVVECSAEVILPTEALRDQVDELTDGRFGSRLSVVPWGIPLGDVGRLREPAQGHVLELLHAGRLDKNKNSIAALESLAHTEQPHRLTIIGSGPELDTLRTRCDVLDLTDRVTFRPFSTRASLWSVFADFDAFLMTTSGLEAFGLVGVEAQAHGLPVLYSDVAGMRGTLAGGGVPYEPGSPISLAAELDRLAADPGLRDTLGRHALENARRFDLETVSRLLLSATSRALGR